MKSAHLRQRLICSTMLWDRVSLDEMPQPSWSHPIWPIDQFVLLILLVRGFSQPCGASLLVIDNRDEILKE